MACSFPIQRESSKADQSRKQLQCANCHASDGRGRYMQPISYDKHCAECHPLSVQLNGTFKASNPKEQPLLDTALEEFNKTRHPIANRLCSRRSCANGCSNSSSGFRS